MCRSKLTYDGASVNPPHDSRANPGMIRPLDHPTWPLARGRRVGGVFEQPAELDARLLLGLGGGLEADRPPGKRIHPGVHGDPERAARKLLYVTLCNPWHDIRIGGASDIRSTKRSTNQTRTEPKRPLTWEPVSVFEPLACRLQEDRPDAPDALAAAMTWAIALTALVTLGLSGDPVHEPVHAGGRQTHRCNRAR
jgi:hypothetical protein